MGYRAPANIEPPVVYGYLAYDYGWRFSPARPAAAATSGRVYSGGERTRCPLRTES
jgi:hypothetical protein